MTSVYDSIVSTMRVLRYEIRRVIPPSQPILDICKRINNQIEAIELGVGFLSVLADCTYKLRDAEVVESHLAIKIEATIQEIASQVEGEEVHDILSEIWKSRRDPPLTNVTWTNFQERASRILDIFTNLNVKIDLLKPKIREACQHLSAQPHYLIQAFDDWRKLVDLILTILEEVRQKNISAFLQNLRNVLWFLDVLVKNARAQDILIHVVNVAIHTALVSCHWWASQFDPNMEEDVSIALLDLRRKVEFTDPDSLDLILRQLKTLGENQDYFIAVRWFVKILLPFRRRLEEWFEEITGLNFKEHDYLYKDLAPCKEPLPIRLIEKLESLTIALVKILAEDDENGQSVLQDFKLLILEMEESFSSYSPLNLCLNFLPKFHLMETEVVLVKKETIKGQMIALMHGLQQLKESPEDFTENVDHIMAIMEEAANLVASLDQSFDSGYITENMARTMLHLLFLKIQLFKLDGKLYNYNQSSMFFVKDRVQSLLEGLKFLINICICRQGGVAMGRVLDADLIDPMVRRVISLFHSLLSHDITDEMVGNVNLMLSGLLDEITVSMAKFRDIYLHVPRSKIPKTNALGFFDYLLTKLKEMLYHKGNLFLSINQHIVEILGHLEFFRCFIGNILETEKEIQNMRDLYGHVVDVAYEAEYLVDLIVIGNKPEWQNLIWLYPLLQNARHLKMQVAKAQEKKINDVKVHNLPQASRHVVSKASIPGKDDVVLSLNDQQKEIIDRLIGGCAYRDIVSIVGMPGVGKTTLAKNVYSHPVVVCHFHVRAWCRVTEVYRKRELLLEILSQIILVTDKIHGMSNEDLEFKLRQLLLKKRYLIVMDDIWNTEVWDDLQISFPEDDNGSRILITSRLNNVALKAKAHSDPYHLRLLSDAESWDLLQMKIFDKACCPEELFEVGREIAKNCKGLPLAIVAMAGILERTGRREKLWKEIANNLSSRIVDDPEEQCRDILELSYNHLPNYLQACFLYFGAFVEDQEIPVKKLIRLWIAEGFVQKTELKSLEDVAEDYLNDLIGRNLVLFAQPRSSGGTKACHVHDMLRSLCQSKAKEDNFLQVITRSNESDDLDFVFNDDFSNSSNYKIYGDHRLCFYSKRIHFVESMPFGPYAHSLLFFGTNDMYARSSYDISFIPHNFKFLKVLDLECINMGPSFPNGIELMVNLRYLAVSGDVDSVPSSIADLWNLETFIVKGLKGKVNLPNAIWCLKRLRHVQVSDVAMINLQDDKLENYTPLDCLINLSSCFLPNREETDSMLRKFPNLRKLGCIFSNSSNCSMIYDHFPRLGVLTCLESLKISYHGKTLHNAKFNFPLSLKKLTLSNFRLPWNYLSGIGRSLPNLKTLKLLSRAFNGERWEVIEGEFTNLKFLKLDTLNIAKWNASGDDFPNLQQLVLRNCKHLEEVPSSFVEISTLQMIEVHWCGKSAEESARRMRKEADEFLKVIISSDLDSTSASYL